MSIHKFYHYEVTVNEDNMCILWAVDKENKNPVTLFPYRLCKTGGWDNCYNEYNLKQFRKKYNNGTAIFR